MKTDMEAITGTIVDVLRLHPPTLNSGGVGLAKWEEERSASLKALFQKLEAAPFYAISFYGPEEPDQADCLQPLPAAPKEEV